MEILTAGEGARQADAKTQREGEERQKQIIYRVDLVSAIERDQHCKKIMNLTQSRLKIL